MSLMQVLRAARAAKACRHLGACGWVICTGAWLLAAGGLWHVHSVDLQMTTARHALESAQASHAAMARSHAQKASGADFTALLPPPPELAARGERMTRTAIAASQRHGTQLAQAVHRLHPGAAGQLTRLELVLSVRGLYPAVKRTIAETLEREPMTVLQQMDLRSASAEQGVEAQVVVLLAARPSAAEFRVR